MKIQGRLWLLCLIWMLSALTGCGGGAEKDAQKEQEQAAAYVKKAHSILEEADSFAAEMEIEVSLLENGENTTQATVTMQKEPLEMQVESVTAFSDTEQETEMYLEEQEEAVNLYTNYNGNWTEMTMLADDAMRNLQIYNTLYNMETIFSIAQDWTITEADAVYELHGVIPGEHFHDVEEYTRFFQMAGMSGLSEVYFKNVADVPVEVTLSPKTGEPLSYEVDLTDALETVTNNVLTELNCGEEEAGITVGTYRIASTLTQLGDTEEIELPAEAKETAVNYEREISRLKQSKE